MKKVILSLVFVLATGVSFMNASSKDAKNIKSIEIVDDFGCRGECNADARYWALELSSDHEDRGAGGELMTRWKEYYSNCVSARC